MEETDLAEKAFKHAKDKIKGRYVEGEKAISLNAAYSLAYARDVIKCRFELGEAEIAKSPMLSLLYAKEVINGRWKNGEEAMKEYTFCWNSYVEFLKEKKAKK